MRPRYIHRYRPRVALSAAHLQVVASVLATAPTDLTVTMITLGEQVQDQLALIREARSQPDAAYGYLCLRETVAFYQAIELIDYSTVAVTNFEELR